MAAEYVQPVPWVETPLRNGSEYSSTPWDRPTRRLPWLIADGRPSAGTGLDIADKVRWPPPAFERKSRVCSPGWSMLHPGLG